jgi:hypothetical protein
MKGEAERICKRKKEAFILQKGRLYLESKLTKEDKKQLKLEGYKWRKPILSREEIDKLKEWLIDARPAYDDDGYQARDFLEFCEYLRFKLGLQKEPTDLPMWPSYIWSPYHGKSLEIIERLISKSKSFFLLHAAKDYLIMGHFITICEHKEMLGNPFQPHSRDKDKTFPVFFYVIEDEKKKLKTFIPQVSILILKPNHFSVKTTLKEIEERLEEFVKIHFLS